MTRYADLKPYELPGLLRLAASAAGLQISSMEAERAVQTAVAELGDAAVPPPEKLVELAALELGLRAANVNVSLCEIARQSSPGSPAIAWTQARADEIPAWRLLIDSDGRGKVLSFQDEAGDAQWIALDELAAQLGAASVDATWAWLVLVPAHPAEGIGTGGTTRSPAPESHDASNDHAHPTPLARLFALLRPERRDLWTVVAYALVLGVLALAVPVAVEALVNTVMFGGLVQPVVVLSILLFAGLAFAGAITAMQTYLVEFLQRRIVVRVIADLAFRLPRVQLSAFDRRHGPELVNRFFDVFSLQKAGATLLLDGVNLVLQAAVGMVVLAFYHPYLLAFDLVLLFVLAFIAMALGRGAVRTNIAESYAKYAIADWLENLARHSRVFKQSGGAQAALERADSLSSAYLQARSLHYRILFRQILALLALQAAASTALLGLGGFLVLDGQLTVGQLVASELILAVVVGSFAKLGKQLDSYYDLLASVDKLGALFDLPLERSDGEGVTPLNRGAAITCRNLSYEYGPGQSALTDVSFDVASGERVAIVGPPGSGKSTLIDLLFGFREPAAGRIEFDGVNARDLRFGNWRQIAALARGGEVFSGTVAENVRLGRRDASLLEVKTALDRAKLSGEISALAEGLHAPLLEGGAPLSRTQAARLALARAVLRQPRLLLVDETLDGLDRDTRNSILESLSSPDAPWTLIVAACHADDLPRMDRVIELPSPDRRNGVPAESGTSR